MLWTHPASFCFSHLAFHFFLSALRSFEVESLAEIMVSAFDTKLSSQRRDQNTSWGSSLVCPTRSAQPQRDRKVLPSSATPSTLAPRNFMDSPSAVAAHPRANRHCDCETRTLASSASIASLPIPFAAQACTVPLRSRHVLASPSGTHHLQPLDGQAATQGANRQTGPDAGRLCWSLHSLSRREFSRLLQPDSSQPVPVTWWTAWRILRFPLRLQPAYEDWIL
jgi:hypothetical protein